MLLLVLLCKACHAFWATVGSFLLLRVQGTCTPGYRVQGTGYGVQGTGYRVQGATFNDTEEIVGSP